MGLEGLRAGVWGTGLSASGIGLSASGMGLSACTLGLHDIRKPTFHQKINFNVPEMAVKSISFVPAVSRTPLLFFFDISLYLTNILLQETKMKTENMAF